MSLPRVPIAEVAEVNPSGPTLSADTEVAFVPMAAVSSDESTVTPSDTRRTGELSGGLSYFQDKDVLVAKITPCFENGKIAQALIRHEHGFGSTEFHVLRAHSRRLHSRYLLHFLRQDWIRREGERRMTGSAGQRRVPKHFLEQLAIPLPVLAEQRRIAMILDKADEVKATQQKCLDQIEELLESLFLERFGDPLSSPKIKTTATLAQVTAKITDGVHQRPSYQDSGVPFISVKDITTGSLRFEDCKFVSIADHQRFTKRCKPERGDVLYTKVGATYGRPALVDTDQEFSIYVSVCLLKPNRAVIDPLFLRAVLATRAVKAQADRRIKGIGVPDLHLDQIREFVIPLPSLEAQRGFSDQVKAIEGTRFKREATLSRLRSLANSLQHRAFRGEL